MKTYGSIFVLTLALTMTNAIQAQAQVAMNESPSATKGTRPQVLPPAGCWYSFNSGTGNTNLSYCVSVNGNILYLLTPQGHEQITPFGAEGYGVCDATAVVEYHDYAYGGDTGNWNSPTLLSQTASSLKIARTTSDGIWTLTQTITQVAASSSIKVAMTLKNNTAAARDVYLVRYADVSADQKQFNNFTATQNSVAAWNLHGLNDFSYGLQLQNVGTPKFAYWNGFAQNIPNGPNACAFANNSPEAVITETDGSMVMAYVDTMPAHGSKTVTLSYKGF
ncbi:MAG TPA: hypothetical protein VJP02_01985 [Candidatus Sulfotelmatobacter sp.]|nr:hypothetical protein [Candidatus Sulfotelmatobacter sp.]